MIYRNKITIRVPDTFGGRRHKYTSSHLDAIRCGHVGLSSFSIRFFLFYLSRSQTAVKPLQIYEILLYSIGENIFVNSRFLHTHTRCSCASWRCTVYFVHTFCPKTIHFSSVVITIIIVKSIMKLVP